MATKPYARTKQVQTTMLEKDLERLDASAAAVPCSRAKLIERFILEGLAREVRKDWGVA